MDTPRVTVVTVVRNLVEAKRVDMFRQCVESVRGQSRPAVEHLIIDGASTDGTANILEQYARQGTLTYRSAPDRGIYDAMNAGLELAGGEFVTFLGSDDFYHDASFLEQAVQTLCRNGADCSYAPVRVLTPEGGRMIRSPCLGAAFVYMPFCHQTVVYKTTILRRYPFHVDFPIAADYEQTLRMLLDGCRFCEIPLCGVTFRSGGSSSRDTARSNADFTRVHLSLYPSQGMSQRRCEQLLRRHAIPRSVFQKLIGASAPEHRPLFEQWRRKDMRRRIIHWFLTWKYREGQCSIRILGIWLAQGAATCAKSKQSLSERGKEEY